MYDEQLSFVSDFGKGVAKLLQPQNGERVLDLGCGTGDLSYEISQSGADVTGIDASNTMIEKARCKYPDITFQVERAELFRTEEKYDAVFSNAALHWMKQAHKVIESVEQALLPGGRFVAEFGGKGNVQTIVEGITMVLASDYEIDATERNPWYFPSLGEYCSLLERHGFDVAFANYFDRPTPLTEGEAGLARWLESFGDDFFQEFSEQEREIIYKKITNIIKPKLFKAGIWVTDYRRLRIVAVKR